MSRDFSLLDPIIDTVVDGGNLNRDITKEVEDEEEVDMNLLRILLSELRKP